MTTLCDASDASFCPADCKTERGSQIYTIFKHKSHSRRRRRRRRRWQILCNSSDDSFILQIARPTRSLRMMRQAAKWTARNRLEKQLHEFWQTVYSHKAQICTILLHTKASSSYSSAPGFTVKTLQRRVEISLAWTLFGIATRTRKPLCTSRYDEHTEETTLGLAFALTIISVSVSVSILCEENGSLPAWFAWSETRWGLVSETHEEKEKETKVVMMMMVVATECKLLQTNFWKHMQKKTVLMMMMMMP